MNPIAILITLSAVPTAELDDARSRALEARRYDTVASWMLVVEAEPGGDAARAAYGEASRAAESEMEVVHADGGLVVINRTGWPALAGPTLIGPGRSAVLAERPAAFHPVLRHSARLWRRIERTESIEDAWELARTAPHSPLLERLEGRARQWVEARRLADERGVLVEAALVSEAAAGAARYRLTLRNQRPHRLQIVIAVEDSVRMLVVDPSEPLVLEAETGPGDPPDFGLLSATSDVMDLPVRLPGRITVEAGPTGEDVLVRMGSAVARAPLPLRARPGPWGHHVELPLGLAFEGGRWSRHGRALEPQTWDGVGPVICEDATAGEDGAWRAKAWHEQGLRALDRERLSEAVKLLEQAAESDPANLGVLYDAACARALRGQRSLALKWLRTLSRRCEPEAQRLLERASADPDLRVLRDDATFASLLPR